MVPTWNITSSKNSLKSGISSRIDSNSPLLAIFGAPLIKSFLWSQSQVFSASTNFCSAKLITRRFNLSIAFRINFFTILGTFAWETNWFFVTLSFHNKFGLDIGFYRFYQEVSSSLALISWSFLVLVYSSSPCRQSPTLFRLSPKLSELYVQPLMRTFGFFTCFADCRIWLRLDCDIFLYRCSPWTPQVLTGTDSNFCFQRPICKERIPSPNCAQ